jgi:hypothetical protein
MGKCYDDTTRRWSIKEKNVLLHIISMFTKLDAMRKVAQKPETALWGLSSGHAKLRPLRRL